MDTEAKRRNVFGLPEPGGGIPARDRAAVARVYYIPSTDFGIVLTGTVTVRVTASAEVAL